MTKLLSKKATERLIDKQLSESPDKMYAFFIFDIDEFKMVNDRYGILLEISASAVFQISLRVISGKGISLAGLAAMNSRRLFRYRIRNV